MFRPSPTSQTFNQWLSVTLIGDIPWSQRTYLVEERGHIHKTMNNNINTKWHLPISGKWCNTSVKVKEIFI